MFNKYVVTANTSENGLTQGIKYIVENNHNGNVYVYDMNGNYLMINRKDNFDNWVNIK